MDGPGDYPTKLSKSDRERQISWYHLYAESKKNDANELTKQNLQNRNRLTDLENEFRVTRGEVWVGGIDWEFATDNVHTAIFKIDNRQGPTV